VKRWYHLACRIWWGFKADIHYQLDEARAWSDADDWHNYHADCYARLMRK
jgi:hypothetical protein